MTTSEIAPVAYYALCARAAWLGIPTSLDADGALLTVDALAEAVVLAEQRAWLPGVGEAFPLRSEILARYGIDAAPVCTCGGSNVCLTCAIDSIEAR